MNILIFGSCVTRDAFDIGGYKNENLNHIHYFARCSLISLNSAPFHVEVDEIHNINLFQQRMVANELNRGFYEHIRSRDLENTFLIVDFIDERFDLIFHDEKYITCSPEFENSDLPVKMTGERIKRSDPLLRDLWKSNCLLFISKLKTTFSPERVILHKAFWKEKFYEQQECFDFSNIQEIQENNNLLSMYYACFELNFPGIQVIDLSQEGYQADKNHKWGHSPFHFTNDFYLRFLADFDSCVRGENKKKI